MSVTKKEFWVASDGKPYDNEDDANAAEYDLCKKELIESYISELDKTKKSAAYARRIASEFVDMLQRRGLNIVELAQRET